jgi:lipopolysaccharide transport system ATP-binding protein
MSDSDVVIRVEGLGKKYSLHHEQGERYTALRDVVARQTKAAGRLLNPFTLAGQLRKAQRQAAKERSESEEEFWALKDVSFEIRRGERVGIIGRNGAGKSTLLKILSRITEPTTGRVEIRGRVASLLEVGTGFHPELTGRENIYLNGAILGMTRREIRSKFDEIVDFAEVEKFLDTPVKRYSSGMYVRLAFAVAAHLEPEILVVDEVLAVGDASFQKKCLGKMKEVSAGEGRTVLFVSHNMRAIDTLCNSALLLEKGLVKTCSHDVKAIIKCYENPFPEASRETSPQFLSRAGFCFYVPVLVDQAGKPNDGSFSQNPCSVLIKAKRVSSDKNLSIGFSIAKQDVDVPVLQSFNVDHGSSGSSFGYEAKEVTYEAPLDLKDLADGIYSLEIIAGIHNQGWIIQPGEMALKTSFSLRHSREEGSILFQQTTRNTILMPVINWRQMH